MNTKKKIIIAEDNQDLLWLLVGKLTKEGYEVLGMPDGVNIVEGHCALPDIFILDKDMDYIDGESITRYLRHCPDSEKVPILMLSGSNSSKSAKAAGVNFYFEKPFKMSEVINTIELTLGKKEG